MDLGVRGRVAFWLLLMGLALVISGSVLVQLTETQLRTSAEDSLGQLVLLERNRLSAEIDAQRAAIERIAADEALHATFDDDSDALRRASALQTLLARTQSAGQTVNAMRLYDRSGALLVTVGPTNEAADAITGHAMEDRKTIVGNSSSTSGIAMAAPIVSDVGEVLGALRVEIELRPVVGLSERFEEYAETSEAFVYQLRADGSCELLTNLRFDRSAAFSALDGAFARNCGDLSDLRMVSATDYRGVDTLTAWSTVPEADWGVAVKMDEAEIFALLDTVRRTASITGLVVAGLMLIGWFALVRPIGSRLARAADAAEELASGNFNQLIEDSRSDEIGRMSESMDRLALDLDEDIKRREAAEARLRVRAETDILTGLMNRHRTTALLEELHEADDDYAVVFLDLDGFKEINDTYGHGIGDDVLRLVAARIQQALETTEPHTHLGRWGGDEFVVVCPGVGATDAGSIAELIDEQFDRAFTTEAGEHRVGVSRGIAGRSDGPTIDDVMSSADASMYQMKRQRDGRSPRLSSKALKMVESALRDDRIEAYLQPFVSTNGQSPPRLSGAEALVRLRNEDGSLESPASFLPGIGASELAYALDLRVLHKAATSVAHWRREDRLAPDFYLSANFGAAAMANRELADDIGRVLDATGLVPTDLVVEVPETAHEVDHGLIHRLRHAGIRVAIDDVGCQYSNLERLVDISADVAKIDRRWVPADRHDSATYELLSGLIMQCRMLDLDVTVEGIETAEQYELLRKLDIARFQGFHFGAPVDPRAFGETWLLVDTTDREIPDAA